MSHARRWRIDSTAKWQRVLRALLDMSLDFAARPAELIFRSEFVEKTPAQRKLFHACCADLAPHWGLSPDEVKTKVKENFYGAEVTIERGRLEESEILEFQRLLSKIGPYTVVVQSSEDSDIEEYGRLIDHLYQMAAESGHELPDRRTR